jgi:hypothetical protein
MGARPRIRFSIIAGIAAGSLLVGGIAYSAPGDPKKELKPADQAYARSILLRRADLPKGTWAATPTDFSQANPRCVVAHYSLSALTVNGEAGFTYAGSPATGGVAVIESGAHVFLTAAQAKRAFGIVTSTGLARCGATAVAAAIKTPDAAAKIISITPLKVSFLALGRAAPKVSGAGFKVHLALRTSQGNSTLELTEVALRRGRALALLALVRRGSDWPLNVLSSLELKIGLRM